ncbi:MAG: LamG-like jellyroll fold domain-containing protein [Myxococcales bacterium]
MYEAPTDDAGEASQAASAGEEATAGSAGQSNHAGASSGGVATSAGTSTGTSGTVAETAGTGGGALGGATSAGGEPSVEPPNGGEAGAPSVPDTCPQDPNKLSPGECGCGVPEAPSATLADCHTLESLLVHRYDFEGSGTAVKDRIGTAHGVIAGGATLSKLNGKGVVQLAGGSTGSYVDLPNGTLSSLKNATLEAWITWGGGNAWQRIFDFGDSSASVPENNPAGGKTYLFLTPNSASGILATAFSLSSQAQEVGVAGPAVLAQTLKQVVVVLDDDADLLQLYLDGVKLGEHAWTSQLSKINDVNAWLGRSQYSADPELSAVYHEFRMYGAALSAAQIKSAFQAGTDPAFLAY